ncbi:hypothetical protein [Flavobacterium koreense]
MKKLIIFFSLIFLFSCNRRNENKHLYFQLEIYEKNLEEVIKAIDAGASFRSADVEYLKKNYDTMSKIAFEIKNSPKTIGDENRVKVIKSRDSINTKFKLYLKFMPSNTYENVEDSIFKKTINIDFLRLTEAFQLRYVLPKSGCK